MECYRMSAGMLPKIHFVDETLIEPPYVHKKRRAGEYIIYFIRHGEMLLTEDGEGLDLRPGDFCVLDKDRIHQGVKATSCEYYYIHFMHPDLQLAQEPVEDIMGSLLRERQSALKSNLFSYEMCEGRVLLLPKHWHVSNTSDQIRLEALLKQAVSENYNPLEHYKTLCACTIQHFLIELSRCFVTAEKENYRHRLPAFYSRVQELMEWLNREYAQEITSQILEQRFGNNFDYMNRSFKKVTGQTIFQYLTGVRINHAKILILHTSMRMREIGEKVGFPDEYYFNRVFKKWVGVPPATYAKAVAVEEEGGH